jgi:hypothetical protein
MSGSTVTKKEVEERLNVFLKGMTLSVRSMITDLHPFYLFFIFL